MSPVLDGSDAANKPPVLQREEQLTVGRFIERIGFRVERIAHGDAERRNPLGMIARIVDLPRKIDEPAQVV